MVSEGSVAGAGREVECVVTVPDGRGEHVILELNKWERETDERDGYGDWVAVVELDGRWST